MDTDNDNLGMLLCNNPVHILLYKRHKRLKFNAGPKAFVQPRFHIRIGITENSDFNSVSFKNPDTWEIGLPVRTKCVPAHKRNSVRLQFRSDPVIYLMSSLNVVITDANCIVLHI